MESFWFGWETYSGPQHILVEGGRAMSTNSAAMPGQQQGALVRKAAVASFIGNFVEWFDYASYGYLATIIAVVFFPNEDPKAALLMTFAIFAISFIIRPLGGIIWGNIGDKYGRRTALSLSILIMSGATFLIALLPTYEHVGILAPILLLLIRMVQGFSASGEYAGASAFLVEYAPSNRRGFYACLVPASTAVGLLVGSLSVTAMHHFMSPEFLHTWGWRIPFVFALPLGLIGRYIRVHLEDTPAFKELEASHHVVKTPLKVLFTEHYREMICGFGVACLNAVGFYVILSYMPTYMSVEMNVEHSTAYLAETLSLCTYILLIFMMGKLSDRFGRKTMLITASICFILFSVPLFSQISSNTLMHILIIQIAFGAMLSINDGTLASFLAEVFPTKVRYTGFAFTFNMANALLGGTAPLVCTWLIQVTGNNMMPAWYLVFFSVIALIAMLFIKETAHKSLRD